MELYKFHAEWCGPCKMMKPIVDEVVDLTQIKLHEVDVSEVPKIAELWKVRSVPTFVILDENHEELWRHTGTMRKTELMAVIEGLKV